MKNFLKTVCFQVPHSYSLSFRIPAVDADAPLSLLMPIKSILSSWVRLGVVLINLRVNQIRIFSSDSIFLC